MAATWQPVEEGFKEICGLLEQQMSPTSDKSQIWQQLQHYSLIPDFNNYLAFIFARAEGKSVDIRQAAGLLLKNNLRGVFKTMPQGNQQYIKSELLPCLGSSDRHIRSTAGTIVSAIVQLDGVGSWLELMHTLVKYLDSNDANLMEGAMDALSKICEDVPQFLDSDVSGLSERPVNVFIPRFLQLFHSPHATLKKLALGCVYQFVMLMPKVLHVNMDKYLQGLFLLANDSAAEVRKLVCAAFVQLVEVHPAFLQVRSAYADAQLPPENLREYLPRLIPVLLSNMVYADDNESLVEADEDGSLPDEDKDIKPRFHSSRFHGSEDADDDDDTVNVWNLRKCSAAALDVLSNVFGDGILSSLMPIVQTKLSTTDDASWKEREAAILALGAVAEGCINGLYPHLSEIIGFLIILIDDKFPLIRSISCWTLSRFSKYVVQSNNHQQGHEQFNKVLMGLLRRMLDDNKRVQEAACSAFATLEEEAAEDLVPCLETILQHLMCAFGKYQRRNLRIVYDAIGTLAEAVGGELNQHHCSFDTGVGCQNMTPHHLGDFGAPLDPEQGEWVHGGWEYWLPGGRDWLTLLDSDKDLFPLLECFTSIAQALGTGFSQFAPPVFQRCINIIQTQQIAKVGHASSGIQYDKEFIVCSLDLLSGLAEGLCSSIESLISQSNLTDLLLQCCLDDASDIRQSAFALLGDLARVCPIHLRRHLSEFLDAAMKQLDAGKLNENVSVANNACWAIGEIAIKVHKEISPVVLAVISRLVPLLQHAEELNKSLVENSAITLGRLAWVCPELVSPHMEHFMQAWCIALSVIRDDIEKEEAFRGFCAMVRANPPGALSALVFMCKAIASWQEIRSRDLHSEVCQVLQGYKRMLENGAWEQCMSALEPPVKDRLLKYLS
ncbi:hypothetical protein DM860_003298 [Cuscuta australis]|uniref:Importin N-terminal domain-containing protein n=1 Tax=Cuscuta australis TaxID=267555 RepID=A0A328D1Z7_9ASTE|nr:hypothetical protein DM860_003298 [Cuscuta australis]